MGRNREPVSYTHLDVYKRQDEGSTGSTAGGQSYTYEDIEATLHKNIVAAGLRVLRL